jgi:hypothetical protein
MRISSPKRRQRTLDILHLLCALQYQGISQVHVQKPGSHMTQLTGSLFVMLCDLSRVIFYVSI